MGHSATAQGEQARPTVVTFRLRRAVLCGVAGPEKGQPSSRRSLATRVSGIRGLKSVHEAFACHRAAGIPRKIAFLDHPSCLQAQAWARWWQSYQGDNCDRAGLAELRQTVIRLRMAEAQPTEPNDKKHLLLRSREVKWCWRCGARVERNSAPRLLLKTACSGAHRTKEHERALSFIGKGQRPKSSEFIGHPTPISDEEWERWHESHGSLFFCLRELSCS